MLTEPISRPNAMYPRRMNQIVFMLHSHAPTIVFALNQSAKIGVGDWFSIGAGMPFSVNA